MADKTAPDALSGLTNKEVDAKVASAKTEGITAGKAEAETAGKSSTEAAVASAKADAVKAERERIGAIMSLEEAKGREAAAFKLAMNGKLSADEAKEMLAGMPKATAPHGERASDSPVGLAGIGDKKTGANAEVLSPDEVAAMVNKRK